MNNPWKPDPDDKRVPIGPGDCISMHRQAWFHTTLSLPYQHRKNARNVGIRGCVKGIVRKLYSLGKEGVVIHRVSIAGWRGGEHAYFPVGFSMQASSLFLPLFVFTKAYENFARGRK